MTLPAFATDELVALFRQHGSTRVDTHVLQPAAVFLELSGESIRRRLFLTQDAEGREFCLRPEHTIPVCLEHIRSGRSGGEYSYLGPVFRQRNGEASEFAQAGIESIGRSDRAAAEADVFKIAADALALFGRGAYEIGVGDMGLLDAVLDSLSVPTLVRRRLVRRLSAGADVDAALLDDARPATSDYAGLLGAIQGQDPRAAKAFVEDVIAIAGISAIGGRSAGDIAERFLSRASDRSTSLNDDNREILRRFLSIAGDLRSSAEAVRKLADETGLQIGPALAAFEERTREKEQRGVALDRVRFAARSTRNMDYYTGFIFEVRDLASPAGQLVISGGRYDRLLEQLGAAHPAPAVGCAFWLDRLGGAAA